MLKRHDFSYLQTSLTQELQPAGSGLIDVVQGAARLDAERLAAEAAAAPTCSVFSDL